ncbi:hypothetical protein AB4238_00545 [Shewanella sp. 10N.286.45.A1]|uniref:hypothetical protein n=1 Tax=Shewanella sp. 10N.286.45.A1 TaxID=3229694 RepID=UPI00355039BC
MTSLNKDMIITVLNHLESIVQYRAAHNKFVPKAQHAKIIKQAPLNIADTKALKYALKNATTGNISTTTKGLYFNDEFLSMQLAAPKKTACYPIPDKLHITVDITEEEAEALLKHYKKIFRSSSFLATKTQPKRKQHQYYKEARKFSLKGDSSAVIYMFLGDNAKRQTKHNMLRIELVPARFTRKQLNEFFYLLKGSKLIKHYKAKMREANVTRCDIAIDLLCIPTPLAIIDKPNVVKFSNHSQHAEKDLPHVQSIYISDPSDSHNIIYSKTEKLIELPNAKTTKHLPLLLNEENSPLSVTRFEHSYLPQQSGTGFCLKNLHTMSDLFKSVEVYGSGVLRTLNDDQLQQALKDGFLVSVKNEYHEAVFKSRADALQRYSLYINRDEFKAMQKSVLRKLKKCIISPDYSPE